MPAQTVSFVNPIDPIGQALALQQAQRQAALADELRQQSFAPTPDNGGNVSWTQGLAKLAQAIAANHLNRKSMETQYGAAQQGQSAMRAGFGLPPTSAQPNPYATSETGRNLGQRVGDFFSGGPPVHANVSNVAAALGVQPSVMSDDPRNGGIGGHMPTSGVSGGPADGPAASPQPAGAPAMPQGGAAPQMPPQGADAPPMPQQPMRGPMSLSGNGQQDMYDYSLNSGEYTKALIAAHSPTPVAKALQEAGIDPNSTQGRAYMIAAAQGAATGGIEADRRGYVREKNTGRVVGYEPDIGAGKMPIGDANGNVTGATTLPGYTAAEAATERARAFGSASGRAEGSLPYETTETYNNATGQREITPRAATLNGHYNTTAPLGAPKFADAQAASGADYFSGLSRSAADVPNQRFAVHKMLDLVNAPGAPAFGPGTQTANEFAGLVNGAGKAFGYQWNVNDSNITKVGEFNKLAAQLSSRMASDTGMNGSDKRLDLTIHANPNSEMTSDNLRQVLPMVDGFLAAKQGQAAAATTYAKANPGPNAQAEFTTLYNKAYDPRVYQVMSMPPAQRAATIQGMSAADRATLRQRYNTLHGMGAIQ